MIRIPLEKPEQAEAIWYPSGNCRSQFLYRRDGQQDFEGLFAEIVGTTVLPPTDRNPFQDSGSFESRFRRRLDISKNAEWWDSRWTDSNGRDFSLRLLGEVRRQADRDFRPHAIWADHRASAYAELHRGGFIMVALMGSLAVLGALVGVVWGSLGVCGKVVELFLLSAAFYLVHRSRKLHWRERWLNYRQLERQLSQVSYLILLGRGIRFLPPAHGTVQHEDDLVDRMVLESRYTSGGIANCIAGSRLPFGCS